MTSFPPNDVAPRVINVDAESSAALDHTAAPSLPAGTAANLDLLTDHVPEGGIAAPTEAERATWTQALTKIGDIKDALGLRTRVAGWTEFAMCALLYWHSPDKGFSHAFGSGKLTKPGSNRAFACAASALYGLDVGDADHGTANSKRVNSKATQFDGLLKLLRDQDIRIEGMPLSRDSVQLLVSLIEEAGGLNALERLTERDKDPDWAPEPLELDPKKKSVILQARALSALQDGSDVIPKLVFVHKKEDGTEQELPVPDNIVSLAVAAQAPTPPRTQAFAELLEMGGCVLPEPTDELKTKASDPNDGRTEWRIDERQVVWDPDQRIIQGLLKAKGGTVVVECWNHEPTIILGARVEGDTRLYTQMGKRIKVNILARERRPVFDVDVEATEKKSGVGMLKVSSAAANPGKPIRALLQRLTGEGFVDVDPRRLKASAHCEISRGVLHGFASAYIEKADKAVRNASKPRSGTAEEAPGSTVEFGSDGITVQSAKVDAGKKPVAGKVKGTGSISVRLDDLTAFLKAFIAVYPEVNTEVKCSLGDRVLVLEFGTTSARYRVMIPQANRGARSDGFTTPLVRREWPEGVVLKTIATV